MELETVERKLFEYVILERRIEAITKEKNRSKLLDIALSLGPKEGQPYDLTVPKVQNIAPQDWAYNWDRACELLRHKDDMITETIADCARKQIDIRYKVGIAGLTEKETLYCEERYFLGLSAKEIDIENKKEIRNSALVKIGKIYDRDLP